MKIQHIATTAFTLSFIALSGLVSAKPTVYGKANVSLNKHDAEAGATTTQDNWQLNSNASRLGFKGRQALEDDLKAIYQLEYEISVDTGKAQTDKDTGVSSTFKQRNIYVGLEGDFGQIIAGNFDTPFKTAQDKVDRFGDLPLGDIKEVLNGENRASNIIQYTSPEMNGFTAQIALIPGEDSGAEGDDESNGPADSTSVSVKYKIDDFWVALAADSDMTGKSPAIGSTVYDGTRLVAEYRLGKTKVGALIQSSEESEGEGKSTAYMLSAQHKINQWVLKGQYTAANEEMGANEADTTLVSLGADYKLNKKVKLYGYLSQYDSDVDDEEKSTAGFGTEIKF